MQIKVTKLKNGLTVILAPTHSADVVTCQVWVKAGSADEKSNESGIAHVMEHMLFKGTKKMAPGEITRKVEDAGGTINAWTSFDETVYYISMAGQYRRKSVEILADAVQNSSFGEDDLKSELMVIREEIRMGNDSPDNVVMENLFELVFKGHHYGVPIIGYDEVVKSFNKKKVTSFYRRFYIPSNITVVVSGNFEIPKMGKKIESLFSDFSPRLKTSVERPENIFPAQKAIRMKTTIMPVSECQVLLGFPAGTLLDVDIPALDILGTALGMGVSSRLVTELKHKKQLVNSVAAMAYTPARAGLFSVVSSMKPANLIKAVKAIFVELKRIIREPLPFAELKKARDMLLSESYFSSETTDQAARRFGYYKVHANDHNYESVYMSQLENVDSKDIQKVAAKYLRPEKLSVSLLLPEPEKLRTSLSWVKITSGSASVDEKYLKKIIKKEAGKLSISKKKKVTVKSAINTELLTLSNGTRLIVRSDPVSKLVATRAIFPGGVFDENKGRVGITSLVSRLLTRGTKTMSADEVARKIDEMSRSVHGFSGRNSFGINGEFLADKFEKGMELMASCLLSPSLAAGEIKKQKALIVEEIKTAMDNPGHVVFRQFEKKLFGTHPYGASIIGTSKSIKSLSRAKITNRHQFLTGTDNMIIAVDGGVSKEKVVEILESFFNTKIKKAKSKRKISPWTPPEKPILVCSNMQREQSHVVAGFPGVSINSGDRFALDVLVELLGGHSGRLFNTIREEKGLAYMVTGVSMAGIHNGYIAFYLATASGNEKVALAGILEELEKIKNKAPLKSEISGVKRYLLGTKTIGEQKGQARVAQMALGELYGLGWDAARKYEKKLSRVTPEDIRCAAKKYFDSQKLVVSVVGNNVESMRILS